MSNQFLKLRRSGVPGKIPSTSSIDYGEIALNTYDGIAYMKRSGSNGEEVVPIGSNSGSFSGSFQGTFTGDGSGLTNLPIQNINTGSLVTTASFNAFTASYNTGSFTGSFSGSLHGTASWAQNAITASYYDETDPVFTAVSGTFTTTSSFNTFTASYSNDSASFDSRITNNSSSIVSLSSSFTSFSSSYNTGSFTGQFSGSFSGSGANLFGIPASGIVGLNLSQISSGSYSASISEAGLLVNNRVVAPSFTGSLFGTASWADNAITSSYALNATSASYAFSSSYALSASHASTASHVNTLNQNVTVVGNQTISGSLTITNNLTVLGSASVTYISESTLNIGTNLITVNTFDPSIRFGGLAVIDSGSSPLHSGSFLFDSQKDQFIFIHQSAPITSSVFLLGPETYNNLGNETYLTQNRIPKGSGIEHLYDSNISDNGSIVSINSNTEITGSLVITQGVTGSLFGTSSWASNALTASYILNAISSSFATSASFAPNIYNTNGSLTGARTLTLNSNPLDIIGSTTTRFFANGRVGIGTTTDGGFQLDVNGTTRLQNTLTISAGGAGITGNVNVIGSITGSAALISGSGTQRLTVIGSGSAQPLFTVQGSQGELFSIVDSLSGSLFSVNDISGLPIMEVFSDSTTLMGNYLAPSLNTTVRTTTTNSGSFTIYAVPTASYDGIFMDYTAKSGSAARAGQFMAIWSGSLVNFTDNSTTDFGNTARLMFTGSISGSNMVVTGNVTTGSGWTIKAIIRSI